MIRPSFITKLTFCRGLRSSSGFPSTPMTSASLPGDSAPISADMSTARAADTVAARSASVASRPIDASCSNSRALGRCGMMPASVPTLRASRRRRRGACECARRRDSPAGPWRARKRRQLVDPARFHRDDGRDRREPRGYDQSAPSRTAGADAAFAQRMYGDALSMPVGFVERGEELGVADLGTSTGFDGLGQPSGHTHLDRFGPWSTSSRTRFRNASLPRTPMPPKSQMPPEIPSHGPEATTRGP